ncbi:MAG: hypothetical protein LBP59_10525 [Planctomycetaceae bacterium]|nr:hypothetical protein [Planctomycetaceae bacterium]
MSNQNVADIAIFESLQNQANDSFCSQMGAFQNGRAVNNVTWKVQRQQSTISRKDVKEISKLIDEVKKLENDIYRMATHYRHLMDENENKLNDQYTDEKTSVISKLKPTFDRLNKLGVTGSYKSYYLPLSKETEEQSF